MSLIFIEFGSVLLSEFVEQRKELDDLRIDGYSFLFYYYVVRHKKVP